MIVKIHKGPDGKKVVAVCDSDLVGRKFEDGDMQLDVASSFYNGEKKNEEELLRELRQPCNVNIVGEKSIKFFVGKKLIDKKSIIKINRIPHAQCVLIDV